MYLATRTSRAGVGVGLVVAAVLAGNLLGARPAEAASFINRGLTLPGGQFELGLGLGLAHADYGPTTDYTGIGVNMELAYGLSHKLELRFRTGLRFGSEGRVTNADYFGHPVETESFNPGGAGCATRRSACASIWSTAAPPSWRWTPACTCRWTASLVSCSASRWR